MFWRRKKDHKKEWESKIATELPKVKGLLLELGYQLDEIQPNLMGEKFLMKIDKFILSAKRISDGQKVIVKISKDSNGIKEIEADRNASKNLEKLPFALDSIKIAEEYYFDKKSGYIIFIIEFLEQETSLMKLPLDEQFYITLRAFDVLENIYLATKEHKKYVKDKFAIYTGELYLQKFTEYRDTINSILNDPHVDSIISSAKNLFLDNLNSVKKFEDFFVHEDFVQQNFRIKKDMLYFIDHEALRFGNLFETQARYLNFMLVHSPLLEKKYIEHLKINKDPERLTSLRMMRLLKCTQLLEYYAKSLQKTQGNEYAISKIRFDFWLSVLEHLMNDSVIHESIVNEFKDARNKLRSPEEIERQKLIKHL